MNPKAFSFSQLSTLWREKLAVTAGLTVLICVPYFGLQHVTFFPVTTMPVTALDRWVSFSPDYAWLYQSLYVFMPVGPMFLACRAALHRYALGFAGLSLSANLLFIFFPTCVIRPPAAEAGLLYRLMVSVDTPRHACPSLHAAFALYAVVWCFHLLPRRGAILAAIWALGILYSTLATKQHVVLDLLAGLLLAGLAAFCAFPRPSQPPTPFTAS